MANDESMTGQELGEKLLESIRQMNAGLGTVADSPIIDDCLEEIAAYRQGRNRLPE
jgi:hypothetical protein